jgi:hypothetical protein
MRIIVTKPLRDGAPFPDRLVPALSVDRRCFDALVASWDKVRAHTVEKRSIFVTIHDSLLGQYNQWAITYVPSIPRTILA